MSMLSVLKLSERILERNILHHKGFDLQTEVRINVCVCYSKTDLLGLSETQVVKCEPFLTEDF